MPTALNSSSFSTELHELSTLHAEFSKYMKKTNEAIEEMQLRAEIARLSSHDGSRRGEELKKLIALAKKPAFATTFQKDLCRARLMVLKGLQTLFPEYFQEKSFMNKDDQIVEWELLANACVALHRQFIAGEADSTDSNPSSTSSSIFSACRKEDILAVPVPTEASATWSTPVASESAPTADVGKALSFLAPGLIWAYTELKRALRTDFHKLQSSRRIILNHEQEIRKFRFGNAKNDAEDRGDTVVKLFGRAPDVEVENWKLDSTVYLSLGTGLATRKKLVRQKVMMRAGPLSVAEAARPNMDADDIRTIASMMKRKRIVSTGNDDEEREDDYRAVKVGRSGRMHTASTSENIEGQNCATTGSAQPNVEKDKETLRSLQDLRDFCAEYIKPHTANLTMPEGDLERLQQLERVCHLQNMLALLSIHIEAREAALVRVTSYLDKLKSLQKCLPLLLDDDLLETLTRGETYYTELTEWHAREGTNNANDTEDSRGPKTTEELLGSLAEKMVRIPIFTRHEESERYTFSRSAPFEKAIDAYFEEWYSAETMPEFTILLHWLEHIEPSTK